MTAPTDPRTSGHLAAPVLVGRERELSVLHQHLDAALAGHGSLVLIGGEAGIGKTVLAEAVGREAQERNALVLIGRCYDLTETPPYGPWVELFTQYQRSYDDPPLPAAFAQRGTVGAVTSQAVLVQQVQDFFSDLSALRPVVLMLDDLHWADPASLDLFRSLARSAPTLPLLVLATYRADELTRHHPLSPLLPALVREAHAVRLDLRRWTEDDVRALIATRYRLRPADTAQLIAYLQERAEGNPFFLSELLRTLEEEEGLHATDNQWTLGDLTRLRVPALLRQVIDARVARFDDEGQRLLAVAAVIGQTVPLRVWAAVAEADEETVADLAERAEEARLLVGTPEGTSVQFAHALIREALYEGIPSVRRRRLHRTAGEILAVGRQPDPDAVASHFQRADDERALPWLLQAGERAQAAYAWITAADRFEAALVLMERTDANAGERGWLLLRLSQLLRWVDVAKARTFIDEALALDGLAADRALTAYAQSRRGLFAILAGNVADGLREVEAGAEALAALSETERAHFAARATAITSSSVPEGWGVVVLQRAFIGRFREARDLGERVVTEVEGKGGTGRQSIRSSYFGLGYSYAALGMPDEAAAKFAVTYDLCLQAEDAVVASDCCCCELMLVAMPYRAEDIAGRRQLAARAEAAWERAVGAVPASVSPRFMHMPVLVVEGQWEEAEQLAAVGSVARQGSFGYRSVALAHLATLSRLRGDSERAWWAVWEWLPKGTETEPGTVWSFIAVVPLQREAAALALDDRDLPSAKKWLAAHDAWMHWSGAVLGRSEGHALWAHYHRLAGDPENAYENAMCALADASAPRQPLALAAAHRLVGELDTDARRFDSAREHFAQSLTLADACAAAYERALTLLALANLHAATGNPADAAALLDDVRAICTPLSAKPLLARADALGARVAAMPAAARTDRDGLSAREVDVLHLLATGLNNQEIADALSLSVRTVERHITNLYAKIDARGRADATAYALRHGV